MYDIKYTIYIFFLRDREIYKSAGVSSFLAIVSDPVTICRTVPQHAEVRGNLFDPAARLRLARRRHYTPQASRLRMESRCGHNDMWLLRLRNPLSNMPLSRFAISFHPDSPRKCLCSDLPWPERQLTIFLFLFLRRDSFNNIKYSFFNLRRTGGSDRFACIYTLCVCVFIEDDLQNSPAGILRGRRRFISTFLP